MLFPDDFDRFEKKQKRLDALIKTADDTVATLQKEWKTFPTHDYLCALEDMAEHHSAMQKACTAAYNYYMDNKAVFKEFLKQESRAALYMRLKHLSSAAKEAEAIHQQKYPNALNRLKKQRAARGLPPEPPQRIKASWAPGL